MIEDINTLNKMPYEIEFYKKIKLNETDPIKKSIYSFSQLLYIINNIGPFPIDLEEYYYLKYESAETTQLLKALAINYINFYNMIKTGKLFISDKDIFYCAKFIEEFFDFENPININNNSIVWIYPKYSIRKFIAECIKNKSYNDFYINERTLTRLIMIISSFSNYELINFKNKSLVDINHPTLVLANIKLYEKGIIKLVETLDGVGIYLDFNCNSESKKIFTKNIDEIKEKIIKTLNKYESKNYTLKDFID